MTEWARIAGLPVGMDCADEAFFHRRLRAYACDQPDRADMTIKTAVLDRIARPEGKILDRMKTIAVADMGDGRRCRYVSAGGMDDVLSAVYYRPDYTEVAIELLRSRRHPVFSLTDYEYMYTGEMFANRLAHLGGVVLHGSAIAFRGAGIVFSAPSGTGKSTHTRLWRERFGDEVTVLNDDKPAIRFIDGVPFLYGTPWSGKTDLNANIKVPLKAVVFLERATENAIRPLGTVESAFHLTNQIARPYYDADIGTKTLDAINTLILTTPICRLSCNISGEAVRTACEHIMGRMDRA